jgi:hypothetical protein
MIMISLEKRFHHVRAFLQVTFVSKLRLVDTGSKAVWVLDLAMAHEGIDLAPAD